MKLLSASLAIILTGISLAGCSFKKESGKIEIELVQYKPEAANFFEQVEEEFNARAVSYFLRFTLFYIIIINENFIRKINTRENLI